MKYCNKMIIAVQGLIKRSNVKVICTTDDPIDDLHYHAANCETLPNFDVKVLPTFRPDKGLEINKIHLFHLLKQLEKVADKSITF